MCGAHNVGSLDVSLDGWAAVEYELLSKCKVEEGVPHRHQGKLDSLNSKGFSSQSSQGS